MSALNKQVGGKHYKGYKIQPFEFFLQNNIPFHKADIIKRILRYDHETGKGLEDLEKIKHEIDLIMELVYPNSNSNSNLEQGFEEDFFRCAVCEAEFPGGLHSSITHCPSCGAQREIEEAQTENRGDK